MKNLTIRVKPEEAEKFKQEAAKRNMSLRAFILSSVNEKIERDNAALSNNIDKQKGSGSTYAPDYK